MPINVTTYSKAPAIIIHVVGEEAIEQFRKLISRGAEVWIEAYPEIKTAADEIVHGKALQDYTQARKIHTYRSRCTSTKEC